MRPQIAADQPAIQKLHEQAFGPGRFARAAYRVREACALEPELCLAAYHEGALTGAIHFAPVTVGGEPGALLLGPLAIAPAYKGQGWGLNLIQEGMRRGAKLGYRAIFLVGDLAYYARAGFRQVEAGKIWLPGPTDPFRILGAELIPEALSAYAGEIRGMEPPPSPEG